MVCLITIFRRDGSGDSVDWDIVACEGVVAEVDTPIRQALTPAGLSEVEDHLEGLGHREEAPSKRLSFHDERFV